MRIEAKVSKVGVLNQLELVFVPGWFLRLLLVKKSVLTLQGGPPVWFEVHSGQYISPALQRRANEYWWAYQK